ncbi:BTB/POZ domain-containing protein 9 [Fragariocoptes setiger]|uniref:BTB/POZ domain-containing protein 9 n=1 Tax=Fragariocoptes setiger TaxID=1670756 RepID=A0ABQ7SD63_9ACAR|nr:BTB/POZ domain-containing protein 9 [Fragariocoptes setiger]
MLNDLDEFDGSNMKNIEHLDEFNLDISSLLGLPHMCDLTLVIEDQEINVNRDILAVRSQYFHALLFNGMRESRSSRIELPGTQLKPFKLLLQYIYSGRLNLEDLSSDDIADLLATSRTFCFNRLVSDICQYLRLHIDNTNIWSIYRLAKLFDLDQLLLSCDRFFDKNAEQILHQEEFLELGVDEVQSMVKRDSFFAPEPEILRAICKYFCKRGNGPSPEDGKIFRDLLSCVRLSLLKSSEIKQLFCEFGIPYYDFGHFVQPQTKLRRKTRATITYMASLIKHRSKRRKTSADGLDSCPSDSEDIFCLRTSTFPPINECDDERPCNVRGYLIYNRNVATREYNVDLQRGRQKKDMIDSSERNYTVRTCTNHTLGYSYPGARRECIQLAFGRPFIVNNIRMLLLDDGQRSFSYIIEVSTDGKNWSTIVDYSEYWCRSWQHLFFKERVVRYVRITGNRSSYYGTSASQMLLVYFECMYNTIDASMYAFESIDNGEGMLSPKSSVIAIENEHSISIARSPVSSSRVFRICGTSVRSKGTLSSLSAATASASVLAAEPAALVDTCNINNSTNAASQQTNANNHMHIRTDFARGSGFWIAPNKLTFQLAQPFKIDSFAFSLKQSNCRQTLSSYTVSISNDNDSGPWTVVKHVPRMSDELIVVTFEPQVVTFIKLKAVDVPTACQLYVSHIECPYRGVRNECNNIRNQTLKLRFR